MSIKDLVFSDHFKTDFSKINNQKIKMKMKSKRKLKRKNTKKTTVQNYDGSIIASTNFYDQVSKIINAELNEYGFENANEINIIGVGMAKKSGYGQYQDFVRLSVNGFDWYIKAHSTDAQQYDDVNSDYMTPYTYSNLLKKLCLKTLQNGVERLVDELIDNEVVCEAKR